MHTIHFNKGRGALSNTGSRFDAFTREALAPEQVNRKAVTDIILSVYGAEGVDAAQVEEIVDDVLEAVLAGADDEEEAAPAAKK